MTYEPYKKALTTLNPVAVKAGQTEVHAPGHKDWGILTCDECGDKFCIGPSLIYGSRQSEEKCVESLSNKLAEDHKNNRPHQKSYEFPE
jgi:hypothetical protein